MCNCIENKKWDGKCTSTFHKLAFTNSLTNYSVRGFPVCDDNHVDNVREILKSTKLDDRKI